MPHGLSDSGCLSETVGYAIAHEHLTQHRAAGSTGSPSSTSMRRDRGSRYHHGGRLMRPNWEYKTQETALSQVPRMYREAEEFRRLLVRRFGGVS